jgi:hypothetical protein
VSFWRRERYIDYPVSWPDEPTLRERVRALFIPTVEPELEPESEVEPEPVAGDTKVSWEALYGAVKPIVAPGAPAAAAATPVLAPGAATSAKQRPDFGALQRIRLGFETSLAPNTSFTHNVLPAPGLGIRYIVWSVAFVTPQTEPAANEFRVILLDGTGYGYDFSLALGKPVDHDFPTGFPLEPNVELEIQTLCSAASRVIAGSFLYSRSRE